MSCWENKTKSMKKLQAIFDIVAWISCALCVFGFLLFFFISTCPLLDGALSFILIALPLLIGVLAAMSSVIMKVCKNDFEILFGDKLKDNTKINAEPTLPPSAMPHPPTSGSNAIYPKHRE